STSQTPRSTDSHPTDNQGNWQRFPTNSDRNTSAPANNSSKPPLELHHPIVTPRPVEPQQRSAPPAPSRTPDRSMPSGGRSESPRYSPPAHSQSHESHSSGSSHSSSGGHESKSSSSPKH